MYEIHLNDCNKNYWGQGRKTTRIGYAESKEINKGDNLMNDGRDPMNFICS